MSRKLWNNKNKTKKIKKKHKSQLRPFINYVHIQSSLKNLAVHSTILLPSHEMYVCPPPPPASISRLKRGQTSKFKELFLLFRSLMSEFNPNAFLCSKGRNHLILLSTAIRWQLITEFENMFIKREFRWQLKKCVVLF